MNTIILVGRLGRDPEITYFQSGSSVTKSSLAIKRKMSDETDWFSIEAWGKTGEVLTNYTRKGNLVGVEGQVTVESWTGHNGEFHSKLVVKIQRVTLLEKRDRETQTATLPKVNSFGKIPYNHNGKTPVSAKVF
ncbi:single-stranded DNA-binding protein [Microcoleus sp. PH2017_05_CCC_O_A]|uniref:single-stranded DNA-binding protein n=1 Tax=Microcoleus sp. PH2017_05_CCC_O_A TaxID=2798816 RepID=UPI001DF529A2|nr:single-stranded DNA-binding protein [Microcoleus sp. PH2017_05_CCC_O_A]MCC3438580.1 single-stranded DNA-binding protein [Microcoleus sp. PH2017_05_CCC_O_A]